MKQQIQLRPPSCNLTEHPRTLAYAPDAGVILGDRTEGNLLSDRECRPARTSGLLADQSHHNENTQHWVQLHPAGIAAGAGLVSSPLGATGNVGSKGILVPSSYGMTSSIPSSPARGKGGSWEPEPEHLQHGLRKEERERAKPAQRERRAKPDDMGVLGACPQPNDGRNQELKKEEEQDGLQIQ